MRNVVVRSVRNPVPLVDKRANILIGKWIPFIWNPELKFFLGFFLGKEESC